MYKKLKNIFIIIGIMVISFSGYLCKIDNVEAASDTGLHDTRIYGQNRFETSAKLSQNNWNQSYYAVLVNGLNYADAITEMIVQI
ncbi:cell wall-binding repeat-containing protein [Clostridium sp. LBM24168]